MGDAVVGVVLGGDVDWVGAGGEFEPGFKVGHISHTGFVPGDPDFSGLVDRACKADGAAAVFGELVEAVVAGWDETAGILFFGDAVSGGVILPSEGLEDGLLRIF